MIQKILFFSLIFISAFNNFTANAQNKISIIDLKVSALLNDLPADNYSILVYESGRIKDSIFTKKTKATNISLESNKVYSIVFKKENSPLKVVIVNTYFPRGIIDLDQEPFKLEVEISPDASKIKKEFDDYPVAILIVSKKKKLLMASEEYFQLTHIQGNNKKY